MKNENKMEKQIGIRQGDILYLKIPSIPEGLKAVKTDTILQNGSGGNPHKFTGGTFHPKIEGDFVLGYLKAKGTKIFHVEHNPKGNELPDGNYQILKQSEYTHEGLRPIID